MFRLLAAAVVLGLLIGGVRAWLEFGSFDPADQLASLDYPPSKADLWQPPPGKRAIAVAEPVLFEFGEMDLAEPLSHEFLIRNDGNFPLQLKLEETSCICTNAELPNPTLAPGENGVLKLYWKAPPAALAGEALRQWASIATNDPKNPRLTFTVSGKLIAAVSADIAEASFGRVARSQSKTVEFQLREHGERKAKAPLQLLDWQIVDAAGKPLSPNPFTVEALPIPAAGNSAADASRRGGNLRVRVTVKPGLPWGAFLQTIRLHTNASERLVSVVLAGEVASDVYVVGPFYSERQGTLSLVERRGQPLPTAPLRLVMFGASATTASPRVIRAPAWLRVELGAPAPLAADPSAREWRLTVIPNPATQPADELPTEKQSDISTTSNQTSEAPQADAITIETGHVDVPQIIIQVRRITAK